MGYIKFKNVSFVKKTFSFPYIHVGKLHGEVTLLNNTSIKELGSQIVTARKQARANPYRHERDDLQIEDGNSLSDLMGMRNISEITGKQIVPPLVKAKLEEIFSSFELQYKLLGLYYGAGFTIDEIADMESMKRDSVSRSLKRAVKRLTKYLTVAEYDSIRWLLRDYKRIPSNATVCDRVYETSYTCQDRKQFSYHEKVL
jgi:predicted DNA-binding protein YlxM (UPF0122 family)